MFEYKKVEVSLQLKLLRNGLYRPPIVEPAKDISRAVGIKVLQQEDQSVELIPTERPSLVGEVIANFCG
jgi:hypothetical protein